MGQAEDTTENCIESELGAEERTDEAQILRKWHQMRLIRKNAFYSNY